MTHRDLIRRIAFSQIKGLNLESARELIERVGSIDAFFDMPQGELWQLIGAPKVYCSDSERRRLLALAEEESKFVDTANVEALHFEDDGFPKRLAMCDDAPSLVYTLGHCNLNAKHIVSIVGTRNATAYGAGFTRQLVEDLHELLDDLVIVSGLAYGIDVAAHRAALNADVPTVAVVAHGLRTLYPADHRDVASRMVHAGGAILTEYSSTAPVHKGNFLARNRIVAGLCDALVVVESDSHGGALVTANIASAYNREVCAVPGRATDRYSRGCNGLIANQKASLIRGAEDIISLLNWKAKPRIGEQTTFDFSEMTDEMQSIVNYLRANPASTANEISAALGVPFQEISARVMEMELDDLLTSLPGGKYQLNA